MQHIPVRIIFHTVKNKIWKMKRVFCVGKTFLVIPVGIKFKKEKEVLFIYFFFVCVCVFVCNGICKREKNFTRETASMI